MPSRKQVVPVSGDPVAKRVAQYVNAHFEGTLTVAAAQLPCDYHKLWNVVNGVRRKPNLDVLLALAAHSGQPIEWWLRGHATR